MIIDVRCAEAESLRGGQCQLLAGHDAAHALVRSDGVNGRVVRRWAHGEVPRDIPVSRDPSELYLPWAPGMPQVDPTARAGDPPSSATEPGEVVRMPARTVHPTRSRSNRPVTFIGRSPHARRSGDGPEQNGPEQDGPGKNDGRSFSA